MGLAYDPDAAAALGLPDIPGGGGDITRPIFGNDDEIELTEAVLAGDRLTRADQDVHDAEIARREAVHHAQLAWGRALVAADAELRGLLRGVAEVAQHLQPVANARSRLEGSRQLDAAMAAYEAPPAEVRGLRERIVRVRAGLAASELTAIGVVLPKFLGLGSGRAELVAAGEEALIQAAMAWNPERAVRFSTYASWYVAARVQVKLREGWERRCPPESLRVLRALAERRLNRRGFLLPRGEVRELLRHEGSDVDDATLFEWLRLAGFELQG